MGAGAKIPFCSRLSGRAGEQLFGTAVEGVHTWLALEVPQAWGARALRESDLPPSVKAQCLVWEKKLPGVRLQFIRQHARAFAQPGRITFFVAKAHERAPVLYRWCLKRYEDLLDLDVAGLAAGDAAYDNCRHEAPLFLVCTNGKRDRCCAKWGRPIHAAMQAAVGEAVWETTHLGGHRFAATAVVLPWGLCYGRLNPTDAVPLAMAHQSSQLYRLDRLRGRSCYMHPVQAAEYLLREAMGYLELEAFKKADAEERTDAVWTVHFEDQRGGLHRVRLAEERSAWAHPLSCGADEVKHVPQYRLVDYTCR